MLSKFQSTHLKASPEFTSLIYNHGCTRKYGYYVGRQQRCRFKLVAKFLGDKWQLNDINAESVQKNLNKWLSKTQDFLNEVTSSREKNSPSRSPSLQIDSDDLEMKDIFMTERTIKTNTPNGLLSLAAVVSIEQFSRLNGLTGEKMQKIFTALAPESVHHDARSLVEYCCFRFLSRDSSDIHPSLKEPAFQRLIFITMVAWENPYQKDLLNASEKASFQKMTVKEAAFVRIAPAVSGLADRSTAHNLFKALAGEEQGISLSLWLKYIDELLKVHEGRKSYQTREWIKPSKERILCIASSRKRPVLKWDKNMAWPGKLTLTDKAIYFEAVDFFGKKDVSRLDLTTHGLLVNKAKVGPLGSVLFDSAVSVSSVSEQKTWILEFVDLGGEMRRDIWYAFMSEVISLHKFIREYGPEDGDESLFHVYNAHKGKERAINSATNTIARLQALQFMRKLLDDPIKLVQFSYLQNSPYGTVVCQTLAVNFWGGPLVSKLTGSDNQVYASAKPLPEASESGGHVFDIDGSIYLQKWMRSPSWSSSTSIAFWKNTLVRRQGIVLSKNLVVGGTTLVERAVETCKQKCQVAEKTQATIDAAMIQGIPSNIDLFKELMFPLTTMIHNFEKLRRWEEPHITISFLVVTFTVIFRNLLSYMFPTLMVFLAAGMLTLKGLKEQGRLGRSFGKVTIRDQPPSNTIQKIIAVKDAMRDVENHLQNLNVTLLKIRTVILSGQPQVTTEVALVLLSSAIILYVVGFKYILALFVFDLFTRELEFRKEMTKRFMNLLRERWASVPAAPVLVLPFESDEFRSESRKKEEAKSEESFNIKPRT